MLEEFQTFDIFAVPFVIHGLISPNFSLKVDTSTSLWVYIIRKIFLADLSVLMNYRPIWTNLMSYIQKNSNIVVSTKWKVPPLIIRDLIFPRSGQSYYADRKLAIYIYILFNGENGSHRFYKNIKTKLQKNNFNESLKRNGSQSFWLVFVRVKASK